MRNIINLEIFGRPLNIFVVLICVALFWYGAFVVWKKVDGNLPTGSNSADDSAN